MNEIVLFGPVNVPEREPAPERPGRGRGPLQATAGPQLAGTTGGSGQVTHPTPVQPPGDGATVRNTQR
jgi:hypothetical protein